MKRIILLATLVTVGSLSLGVAAFQQPPANAPKVVEVEKLRENLWMLKGGGGNTAVFVRSDGITVVDTKDPGWGQPILDEIKKISTKPITTIINTHTHGDHVSGNVEFPTTVEIIVQENTKANMMEMRGPTGIPQNGPPTNIFKQNNGRGMPTRTQGQPEGRQGRRRSRPLLLRPRPYERRFVGRVPGAARRSCRGHLLG
jgi:glyoxylase-like metal-dependent hydrolase (beta-lactamase superfamily II)